MTQTEITQLVVEYAINKLTKIRATQLAAEIANLPPNNIRCTQLCVEVAVKVIPQTYTDSAAGCNFAF